MTEEKQLQPINRVKEKQEALLNRWIKEIHENPHFAQAEMGKNQNLQSSTKEVLSKIFKTIETSAIPDCSPQTMEPLLQLWHSILKEQAEKGFSTKDTAMLILSLKTSAINFLKEHTELTQAPCPELNKLGNLLDILGLLTFEIYSSERERLINVQHEQINYLQSAKEPDSETMIGNSPQMKAIYQAIGLILENDVTVLLEGESGTGKELIANLIHKNSKRKAEPLITINCGAIPKELVESELFGHEKGSFTGAEAKRIGKFELAHNSTLFLDEVGDLPPDTQVKLLRALQNREVERVGGSEKIKVDVRVIAATNRNLKQLVDENKFRLDLYYRLNVYPIRVPPLRERPSDIIPLAQHFLNLYAKRFSIPVPLLSKEAENYLINHYWEGNVRELENSMQRTIVLAQGHTVSASLLQYRPGHKDTIFWSEPEIKQLEPANPTTTIMPLELLEKKAILQALEYKNGNMLQAAKSLGVSRTTLYNKLKKYQISVENEPEKKNNF